MKYRAEIDGLRTVAVVPVVLFHAGWELFSGGFVGVDVFFVISGYLITSILLSELEQDKFSILRFYERRARRILPALMFVVLCCLPFAWLWLFPADLKDFGQSVVAVATFSSNILFWMESGYFETAGELKPLLHTWSLAVEEQFYIFFPPILFLIWKLGRKTMIGLCILALIVSLALSHWAAYHKPDANFFLLPTRAWELLIGSLCAFWLQKREVMGGTILSQMVSLVGLAFIMASVFLFDDATPFPSLYALLPTLGTAMVILTAGQGTIARSLLSLPPMVGIGLISYSAYLWHQPIFAFARHRLLEPPSLELMLVLGVVSFFLAFLSWKFVEAPFRKRRKDQSKKPSGYFVPLGTASASLGVCLAVGLTLTLNHGQVQRIPEKALAALAARQDAGDFNDCLVMDLTRLIDGECTLGLKSTGTVDFILFGDSHAASLAPGLDVAAQSAGKRGIFIGTISCPPLVGLQDTRIGNETRCTEMQNSIPRIAVEYPNAIIILVGHWQGIGRKYLTCNPGKRGCENYEIGKLSETLSLTLGNFQRESSDIFVVGPPPKNERHIPIYLAKLITLNGLDEIETPVENAYDANPLLEKLSSSDSLSYISIRQEFCDEFTCSLASDGVPIFRDEHHLTGAKSETLAKTLSKIFDD